MTDEFKAKFDKYLKLMQRHHHRLHDNPRLDLMNGKDPMPLDEAIELLEKFDRMDGSTTERTLVEFICDADAFNRVQRHLYTIEEMISCYEMHGDGGE